MCNLFQVWSKVQK